MVFQKVGVGVFLIIQCFLLAYGVSIVSQPDSLVTGVFIIVCNLVFGGISIHILTHY